MLKQLNGDITSAVCLILLREEQQRHKLDKRLLSRLLANGGSFALEQQQERRRTLVMRDQFIKFMKYPSEDGLASLTQFFFFKKMQQSQPSFDFVKYHLAGKDHFLNQLIIY